MTSYRPMHAPPDLAKVPLVGWRVGDWLETELSDGWQQPETDGLNADLNVHNVLDQVEVATTSEGRPITWYVNEQVATGKWRLQTIPAEVVGLSRPMTVFRAPRTSNLIVHAWHGDPDTFCPPIWWDLAIGSGACGLGCRACFLMLTHRIKRDPWRHLLYDNVNSFYHTTQKWLLDPKRRPFHTLGVGIDRSDSLLYEGVTGHVRRLAPIFATETSNPKNCKLILLTKSINTYYLAEIPPEGRKNIVVSFSLNPEPIADLWEGKWPDGQRITPPIIQRLEAAVLTRDLGFETRVRVDPILTPPGWQDDYDDFVKQIKQLGLDFSYWTLGTYREKNSQLLAWAARWGLSPMEWQPAEDELVQDGTHWHVQAEKRIEIYRRVKDAIHQHFPEARVSLCKETNSLRKELKLCNADCNCLR